MKRTRWLVISICLLSGLACVAGSTVGVSSLQLSHNIHETFYSVGWQDGWVLESAEDSWAGGQIDSGSTELRLGDDGAGCQFRSILSFHTGTLPDNALITSARLILQQQSSVVGGGNPFVDFQGLLIDVRLGTFGAAGLEPADFEETPDVASLGPYKPLAADRYEFSLSSLGYANINKWPYQNGLTQFRLRFRLKTNQGGRPRYVDFSSAGNAQAHYILLRSGDESTESLRPQLVVEYHLPTREEIARGP